MEFIILIILGLVSGLVLTKTQFGKFLDVIFGILGSLASYYLAGSFSFFNFASKNDFAIILPMIGSLVIVYLYRSVAYLKF